MECRWQQFSSKQAAERALASLLDLIEGLRAHDHLMAGCIEETLVFCLGSDGAFLDQETEHILPEQQTGIISTISHPEIFSYYSARVKQEIKAYYAALERIASFSDAKLDSMISSFHFPGILDGSYIPGILSMEVWAALVTCERDGRPIAV